MSSKVAPLPARSRRRARRRRRGIVSSSHLVSAKSVELSELEFGLIVAWNAFSRWAVRCMAAAGCPELTITDVLVLHHICHRARNKKVGDICFVLNVEDTHVVGYSLKKLLAAGLAQRRAASARRSSTARRRPARPRSRSTARCARPA